MDSSREYMHIYTSHCICVYIYLYAYAHVYAHAYVYISLMLRKALRWLLITLVVVNISQCIHTSSTCTS